MQNTFFILYACHDAMRSHDAFLEPGYGIPSRDVGF